MGIKTKVFTALVLGAASVVGIVTSPALADNNNAYLNNIAMQMYAQNQQRAAYSPYAYNNYGNAYGANYGNALGNGSYLYGAQTRGAGAYGGYGNGYGNAYGNYGRSNHHGHWWH